MGSVWVMQGSRKYTGLGVRTERLRDSYSSAVRSLARSEVRLPKGRSLLCNPLAVWVSLDKSPSLSRPQFPDFSSVSQGCAED